MPITTIGTSGGNRQLKNPVVGTSTGNKAIQKIWVGTAGGNKLVWTRVVFTLTATSPRWDQMSLGWQDLGAGTTYTLRRGATQIYSGTALTFLDTALNSATAYTYTVTATRAGASVGTSTATATTRTVTFMPMTAVPDGPSIVNCYWTNPGGFEKTRLRSSKGDSQELPANATSHGFGGFNASTYYTFAAEGFRNGVWFNNLGDAGATTGPQQYETREVILYANAVASYNGANNKRTDADGQRNLYFGRYGSTQGQQKSLWTFDIPNDIRHCHRIEHVQFAVWSSHTWANTGTNVGLVVHHGSVGGSTFPGSTGVFGTWHAPKGGWIGGGWVNCTNSVTPGRSTVAEEFRALGATGMGLVGVNDQQSGYGYGLGLMSSADRPRLNIRYTVKL